MLTHVEPRPPTHSPAPDAQPAVPGRRGEDQPSQDTPCVIRWAHAPPHQPSLEHPLLGVGQTDDFKLFTDEAPESHCRSSCYPFFFFFLVFLPFLGPLPWHMEVPRLGVHSELQPPAYTTATATWNL